MRTGLVIKFIVVLFLFAPIVALLGCRGWTTDKTPIHLNPNMDNQIRYNPYGESDWFEDKRTMRPLVDGTVARGFMDKDFSSYEKFPAYISVTEAFVSNGRKNYDIFCSPCHDRVGDGKGSVSNYFSVKPPSLHSDYMYNLNVGYLFNVISKGVRSMPSYEHQITEEDRWSIIAYIRALQLSQNAENQGAIAKWKQEISN